MLPRSRRLTTEMLKEMQTNDAVRVTHSSFFVARTLSTESSPARFAVIISQKVTKGAVERHRIKRRVHHAINDLLGHTQDGWKIALYAKSSIRDASSEEVASDLEKILRKAKVYNG
ncbi:MAG: ribonuclease P protein component [Candidatus Paceibacterota bacterium]